MKPDEHPPAQSPQPVNAPQAPPMVHVMRSVDPARAPVGAEAQRKHQRSRRLYPLLNLSDGEYVVSVVRRHPIGLVVPLVIGSLLIAAVVTLLLSYNDFADGLAIAGQAVSPGVVVLPGLVFILFIAAAMAVSSYVYLRNRFILTNESIIQEIQLSLFSRREQTVSLANVEDASYTQKGLLQYAFGYGSIRLSTEGDETTYRFTYVASPREHVAELNNAVEAFKYGRPIGS